MQTGQVAAIRRDIKLRFGSTAFFVMAITVTDRSVPPAWTRRVGVFTLSEKDSLCYAWFEPTEGNAIRLQVVPRSEPTADPVTVVAPFVRREPRQSA